VRETLDRVVPGASLPADLPGRYSNADTAAHWTIEAAGAAMTVGISGPLLVSAGPWTVEPVEGDFIRVITPMTLYRGWLDGRVLRDPTGRITALHIDGGRIRGLTFVRDS
jgi:D-aminopeptidase